MKRLLNWINERLSGKKVNPVQPSADTEAFNTAIAESTAKLMIIQTHSTIVSALYRQHAAFEAAKARYELDDMINQARVREFNAISASILQRINAQSPLSSYSVDKSRATHQQLSTPLQSPE